MSVSQRLELRQGQSLVMTPQLQQAIKLLQLNNQELAQYIDQEVEQNPLLERPEGMIDAPAIPLSGDSSTPQNKSENKNSTTEETWQPNHDEGRDWGQKSGSFNSTDAYSLENVLSKEVTLREHLLEQINIELDESFERLLALFMIDLLDECGYCKESDTQIAQRLNCDEQRVHTVRKRVMHMDPLGIAAQNLSQCLAVQLEEKNRFDPAMQRLIENLDHLAERNYKSLLKICEVDEQDLKDMIAEIQALNPRPATGFASSALMAIQPDVLMHTNPAGGWTVELNNATLPRVLVNEAYYTRVTAEARTKEEKDYLSERFSTASWLVKSLHQRAQTILKVASEIVRRQHDFFTKGIMHLKPLILKDIADAIDMHESTVSRVTANKFIATPRGTFELKYFFTASIAGADGLTHSAEAVRHRIKALINAEQMNDILSDDTLVDLLKKEGIDIARRTIAKYRESLGIPSSVQRRREKNSRLA